MPLLEAFAMFVVIILPARCPESAAPFARWCRTGRFSVLVLNMKIDETRWEIAGMFGWILSQF